MTFTHVSNPAMLPVEAVEQMGRPARAPNVLRAAVHPRFAGVMDRVAITAAGGTCGEGGAGRQRRGKGLRLKRSSIAGRRRRRPRPPTPRPPQRGTTRTGQGSASKNGSAERRPGPLPARGRTVSSHTIKVNI